MANIVQKWRRIMAVGCNHGAHACGEAQSHVLSFAATFKPHIKLDLGDVRDYTAFRTGAKGSADEAANVDADFDAGSDWLKRYRPTHRCEGNHDHRVYKLVGHHNAVLSYAASRVVNEISEVDRKNKTIVHPYHPVKQWFEFGGFRWGHGIMFNEHAMRDHAETFGNCVIAHLHKDGVFHGRTLNPSTCYCVGMMGNKYTMDYALNFRNWMTWGHGCVAGEVSDKSARLRLYSARCNNGEPEDWNFDL